MGTIAFIFLAAFAAVIYAAVVLLQSGIWLNQFVAIVLILYQCLSMSLLIIAMGDKTFKKNKEVSIK